MCIQLRERQSLVLRNLILCYQEQRCASGHVAPIVVATVVLKYYGMAQTDQ